MTLRTAVSLAALTIALGFAPEAMAQTPPAQRAPAAVEPAPKAPVPGQILVQDANTVLAKQDLIGQTVYAPDKAKIGSISDLILSKDGKTVEGFVIGVGGFLGIGEKSVALKMDRLKMTTGRGRHRAARHGRDQGRADQRPDLQVEEGPGRREGRGATAQRRRRPSVLRCPGQSDVVQQAVSKRGRSPPLPPISQCLFQKASSVSCLMPCNSARNSRLRAMACVV